MENLSKEKLIHCETNARLHEISNCSPPINPMLSIFAYNELTSNVLGSARFTGNFYMICLLKVMSGYVAYGKTRYDHYCGSMMFMKPRQIIEFKNVQFAEKSFIILVHEDYLSGHGLHEQIRKYAYFDYEINEAVSLSLLEEKVIWDSFSKISAEYDGDQDELSTEIILSHLSSILQYSDRFYRRQFVDRSVNNSLSTTRKFHQALKDYFKTGQQQIQGLPSVNHLAGDLFISTRYLSEVLKQETGKNALEHIHIYLIAEAKNQLLGSDNNVSGIAYQLGFDSPSYFTRLFKKVAGVTPMQYKEHYTV